MAVKTLVILHYVIHTSLVERILSHRGDLKKMQKMVYLVKWVGFPDSDNTWLPHAELRDNEYLHAYLREHGLVHLIPRRHRGKRKSKKDLV